MSDFTNVPSSAGMVYVAFVIEVFARRIVGWRASQIASAQFVLDALKQAVHMRRPTERLVEAGIDPSVDSVGDSCDNALAEAAAGLLTAELSRQRGRWPSLEALDVDIRAWLGRFKHQWPHGFADVVPPAEPEAPSKSPWERASWDAVGLMPTSLLQAQRGSAAKKASPAPSHIRCSTVGNLNHSGSVSEPAGNHKAGAGWSSYGIFAATRSCLDSPSVAGDVPPLPASGDFAMASALAAIGGVGERGRQRGDPASRSALRRAPLSVEAGWSSTHCSHTIRWRDCRQETGIAPDRQPIRTPLSISKGRGVTLGRMLVGRSLQRAPQANESAQRPEIKKWPSTPACRS